MERTLRERNRLRKLEDARKEKRLLNPTEAQLMQSREYLDWFQMQPEQYGDEPPNNTFDLFLTERRRVKEKERLRLFEEQRKAARQQLRQEREAAQPVRTEPEPAAPKRRGRPIDPRSKRQRDLAAASRIALARPGDFFFFEEPIGFGPAELAVGAAVTAAALPRGREQMLTLRPNMGCSAAVNPGTCTPEPDRHGSPRNPCNCSGVNRTSLRYLHQPPQTRVAVCVCVCVARGCSPGASSRVG